MKKKMIEKIPYMGAKYTKAKGIELIARAAVKKVENEKHLIVEIYQNTKDAVDVPTHRIVLSKNNHGWYTPADGSWRQSQICEEYGFETIFGVMKSEKCENVRISKEELEVIEKYTKHKNASWQIWPRMIYYAIRDRNREKKNIQNNNKELRVQQYLKDTPELSEELKKWAKDNLFLTKNYMFYKIKGNHATLTCSKCGNTKEYKIRTELETYEESLEHRIIKPQKGCFARCEFCKAAGSYQQIGKYKQSDMEQREYCFDIEPFRKDGVVVRYIMVEKDIISGQPEQHSFTDIALNWYLPGRKTSTKAYAYDIWSCKYQKYTTRYIPYNQGGYNNIVQTASKIHPASYKVLEQSFLKYSALKQFVSFRKEKVANYLDLYLKHPEIEMLVKLGLTGMVQEMLTAPRVKILNKEGKSIEERIGINKGRLKLFQKAKGDSYMRALLRTEKEYALKISETTLWELYETFQSVDSLARVRKCLVYTTAEKLLNALYRYAGCTRTGTPDIRTIRKIQSTLQTYDDYLSMRRQSGYNLTNSIILYPRDLHEAHQKMVLEINKAELDKRIADVNERYEKIAKNYEKLSKKYSYEADRYCIRPASSAGEIVIEGRTLHHCVGGDRYLNKHNTGTSYILFLRDKERQNIPYITVEISSNGEILQWYGAHDKKPDPEYFEKWLENYLKHLNRRKRNTANTSRETQKVALMVAV